MHVGKAGVGTIVSRNELEHQPKSHPGQAMTIQQGMARECARQIRDHGERVFTQSRTASPEVCPKLCPKLLVAGNLSPVYSGAVILDGPKSPRSVFVIRRL